MRPVTDSKGIMLFWSSYNFFPFFYSGNSYCHHYYKILFKNTLGTNGFSISESDKKSVTEEEGNNTLTTTKQSQGLGKIRL
jgi:hypothetical protein